MVVDSSALVAILLGDSESKAFIELLAAAEDPVVCAGTLLEASIVMHTKIGPAGVEDLNGLIGAAAIRCVAFDAVQAELAVRAFQSYGKGHAQPGLNFGDCFSYALAKMLDRPLLFKGNEFAQTDLESAPS